MKIPVERLNSRQIANPISATPTYAELMTALGAGAADVFAMSGRVADSVLVAPDRWFYIRALTEDHAYEPTEDLEGLGQLRVHVERQLQQGQIVVAEQQGLSVGDDGAYALITE